MREIKFNIPDKGDFKRWWGIIKFKINGGFKCIDCGTKMQFNHVALSYRVEELGGKEFLFDNHTMGLCPDCTRNELDKNAEVVYHITTAKCNWCDEVKPTADFIRFKNLRSFITFGRHWWNGHNICQDCMNVGLANSKDKMRSSFTKWHNGKGYCKNELGLWIEDK